MTRRFVSAIVLLMALVTGAPAQEPQVRKANEPVDGIFACGEDLRIPPILLRWGTVVLAGDGRLFSPCAMRHTPPDIPHAAEHREIREQSLLARAVGAGPRNPEVVWRGLQAYARLGLGLGATVTPGVSTTKTPDGTRKPTFMTACSLEMQLTGVGGLMWWPGEVFQAMRPTAPSRVRAEAATGLGTLLSAGRYDSNVARWAAIELEKCVLLEKEAVIRGSLLEALGRVRFPEDAERKRAERFLVHHSRGVLAETLGAALGLEVLIRLSPRKEVDTETTERLREMATLAATSVVLDETPARIRRLALMTLQHLRDTDTLVLERLLNDADWQVRRLVVQRIAGREDELNSLMRRFESDEAFQVRYELLTPMSRWVGLSLRCEPIVKFLDDESPLVAMRAMDVLNPRCTDLGDTIEKLDEIATHLERESEEDWHKPSRALTALSRLAPAAARKYLPTAMKHSVWQVRAAAAAAAANMNDGDTLLGLARDPMPNVRTAAIEALVRIKHPGVYDAALAALESEDYQLLRAAAVALRFLPEARREEASNKLLATLHRVTTGAEDTSRDARVAMLERLGEVLPPFRASDLHPFVNDFDPEVSAAAIKAHEALGVGTPAVTSIQRRYPYQPSEEELGRIPRIAEIHLKDGTVRIELLQEVAPVTIARFAALAQQGYYNGLTFHRIVPNFVVQGGSPGANEYVGSRRFMRDELGGAHHVRGAVGISTRGRDTGDAQIFIDLVDLPRLDRDYTVFGYVTGGMELVDKMLEGAVIKAVVVK